MDYINLVIAVIALLLSGFTVYWQFCRKPDIRIIYKDEQPFRKLSSPLNEPISYPTEWFIRIMIKNNSRIIARNCIGKITEWYTEGIRDSRIDPVKLHWVSNSPEDYSGINLSYQDFDYIDLIYTKQDKQNICIYTNTHPRAFPICFDFKKNHIFKFALYSDNEVAKFKMFKVWYCENDEDSKLRFIRLDEISEKEFLKSISGT